MKFHLYQFKIPINLILIMILCAFNASSLPNFNLLARNYTVLQRGFLVFERMCLTCHSLRYICFRDLQLLGFSTQQIQSIARKYNIENVDMTNGQLNMRTAQLSDPILGTFSSASASIRSENKNGYGPDLSLITKARHGGGTYIYQLLMGFEDKKNDDGFYENAAFPGGKILMPPPFINHIFQYPSSMRIKASPQQMSQDVTAFLVWSSDPMAAERYEIGSRVLMFLCVFTMMVFVLYLRVKQQLKLFNKE